MFFNTSCSSKHTYWIYNRFTLNNLFG